VTAWYEGYLGRDVGNLPVIWRVSKQAIFFKKKDDFGGVYFLEFI